MRPVPEFFAGPAKSESENYFSGPTGAAGSYANGLPEGEWHWWYITGAPSCHGWYKDGRREGTWTTWDTSGEMTGSTQFVAGNIVSGKPTHFFHCFAMDGIYRVGDPTVRFVE